VRRLDVRDPVADRLARRLLQRLRAELHRTHLGAEQAHPLDVRPLPAHVLGPHVDDALETEACAHRGRGDTVLPRAGLGDDPPLPEPPREHGLAERVVQLVRARVEQVLALQVEPLVGSEALRAGEGRRPAGVAAAELVELRAEALVRERGLPHGRELVERRHERLGDVATAVAAVRRHEARAAST
jgi:hypothetical protein